MNNRQIVFYFCLIGTLISVIPMFWLWRSYQWSELGLLTTKPFLYVFNVDEDQLTDEAFQAEMQALVEPAEAILLNAKLESEVAELDDESTTTAERPPCRQIT